MRIAGAFPGVIPGQGATRTGSDSGSVLFSSRHHPLLLLAVDSSCQKLAVLASLIDCRGGDAAVMRLPLTCLRSDIRSRSESNVQIDLVYFGPVIRDGMPAPYVQPTNFKSNESKRKV